MKNKILLAIFLAAITGTAWAGINVKRVPCNVYYKKDNKYILIACACTGVVPCSPASVPATPQYFCYNQTNGYLLLAVGTPLYRCD